MVYTRKRKYEEDQLVEKKKASKKHILNDGNTKSTKSFVHTRSNKLAVKSNLLDTQRKSEKLENLNGVKKYKKKNGKVITIEFKKETKYHYESSNDSGVCLDKLVDSSNNSVLSNSSNCDENQEPNDYKQHDFKTIWLENNLKPMKVVLEKLEDVLKTDIDQKNSYPFQMLAKANLFKHASPLHTTNLNLHSYSHNEIQDKSLCKKLSSAIKKSNIETMHKNSKDSKVIGKNSKANSKKYQVENLSVVTRKRSLKVIDKVDSPKVSKLENSKYNKCESSDVARLTEISNDSNKVKVSKSVTKLQTLNDRPREVAETKKSSLTVTPKMSKVPGVNKNSKTEKLNDNESKSSKLDKISKTPSIGKYSESASKLKTSHHMNKLEDECNELNNSKVLSLLHEYENKDFIMQEKSDINIGKNLDVSNESNSSDSEWEEVAEQVEQNLEDYKPNILHEGVQITIASNDRKHEKRRLKREREMECVRLNINKIRRNNQLLVHKVDLLCLLARGFHLNNILNSPVIKAIALSFIPNEIIGKTSGKKVEKVNVSGIRNIMLWFCKSFTYTSKCDFFTNMLLNIVKSFQNETAVNVSYYNLMFIVIARVLGFNTRFCMSLYPTTFKAQNLLLKSKKGVEKVIVKLENANYQAIKSNLKSDKREKVMSSQKKRSSKQIAKNDQSKHIKKSPRTRNSKPKNYKISDDETDDTFKDEDFVASDLSDEDSGMEENYNGRISEERKNEASKITAMNCDTKKISNSKEGKRKNSLNGQSWDISDLQSDDDDFEPVKSKRTTKGENSDSKKKQSKRKTSSKAKSSISESWYKSEKIVCWAEIFSKTDKKWISVDCVNKLIGNSYEFEALALQPVSYVVAYDNDSYVKDVTSRYCSDFMIGTRKLRVVSEWWKETLKSYSPPRSKMNMEEDDEMDMMLIHKPIPQTLSGLKDHPLYALKRHLLKFEALYPPDTNPVGFLRGEPIYPRDCVAKLQSREQWFKKSRVVRPGEEPYKMSTHLTWDKINRVILKDVPLELFGFWQTDPYQPPVAKDGKIPRNEYGNVELFRPDMLPVGTVQIKIPGINRIAQKLDIDCSPAVTGFELTKGHIRPVFDGFIVCEEFKDILMKAWEEEQKTVKRKQREKNEKRIYGNWKKLIKGLLIRERLKLKYHLN